MNWAAKYRQDWISETLRVFGFINRTHLRRKFGLGPNGANRDFVQYKKDHPGAIIYNEDYKCYMLADGVPKGIVRLRITRPSKRGPNRH